jgi:hypothetical protein
MLQVTGNVRLSYWPCLAALLLLSVFTGCNVGTSFHVLEHNIIVSEYVADAAQSNALVKGVAKNIGPWLVEECGVSVTFYDYRGNTLAVRSSSCKRLEPGQSWNFTVELKGQDAWKVGNYSLSAFSK